MWSGAADISRVWPLCPCCPPDFLPLFFLRLCDFKGRFSSFEGGSELFVLFFGVCKRANLSSSVPTFFSRIMFQRDPVAEGQVSGAEIILAMNLLFTIAIYCLKLMSGSLFIQKITKP